MAGKVLHVPGSTLGLGALVREDDLEKRFWFFNCNDLGNKYLVPTSSHAEHLGLTVSAWCLPQKSVPSL